MSVWMANIQKDAVRLSAKSSCRKKNISCHPTLRLYEEYRRHQILPRKVPIGAVVIVANNARFSHELESCLSGGTRA